MVEQVGLETLAELQERLASRLELKKYVRPVNLVGGADCGYDKKKERIGASIVVLRLPDFEIVEISQAIRKVKFPYVPTFLSFREGPVFFDTFRKIKRKPDVTFFDGNGIAHPRRMGLASYVGILLGIATIGCAKNPLYPFLLPPEHRGAYTSLLNDKQEKVGVCLRTRTGVKPVFVSPGHRADIASSMELVLRCTKFRIPEPLRAAHRLSREIFQRT